MNEKEFACVETEYPMLTHFRDTTFFIHPLVLCAFTGNNAIFDQILTLIDCKESVERILTDCEYTIGHTNEFNVDKTRYTVIKGNSGIAMAWYCQSDVIKTLLLYSKEIVLKLISSSVSFLIPSNMPLLFKANMFMVAAFKKDYNTISTLVKVYENMNGTRPDFTNMKDGHGNTILH